MDIQELITRGRFLFSGAPVRLEVFKQVNGKRTAKEIAAKLGRHVNNVRSDLTTMENGGLIQVRMDTVGIPVKRDRYPLYEKIPLARTVSLKYFRPVGRRPRTGQLTGGPPPVVKRGRPVSSRHVLKLPNEEEILEICSRGEDQIFEFKGVGTDLTRVTKEIAAMLHTRQGGMIFYGVDDDGSIQGSDQSRQQFDQSLQNSLRDNIDPPPTVTIHQKKILGSAILIIIVPPWNRKEVYLYRGKVLIRKGTNAFGVKSEESKKLYHGEYVS